MVSTGCSTTEVYTLGVGAIRVRLPAARIIIKFKIKL